MNKFNHSYFEAIKPKLHKALARNKCSCCGRGIFKNEDYVMLWLIDRCPHRIGGGKTICMNKKVKLCKMCLPAMFSLSKVLHETVVVNGEYAEKALKFIKQYGIPRHTRYDIAKGTDLVKEYIERFKSERRFSA